MKKLTWFGDSLDKVKAFPPPVQDDIGYAVFVAQMGKTHHSAKPLHGSAAALWRLCRRTRAELIALSTQVSIGDVIYVVHAFQKKSKTGIATPKTEIELVRRRLQQLRSEVKNSEKKNS